MPQSRRAKRVRPPHERWRPGPGSGAELKGILDLRIVYYDAQSSLVCKLAEQQLKNRKIQGFLLPMIQVLLKSGCNCCSKELTCTIRDALYQPEYGGDQGPIV